VKTLKERCSARFKKETHFKSDVLANECVITKIQSETKNLFLSSMWQCTEV